jgi:hypothetical protein
LRRIGGRLVKLYRSPRLRLYALASIATILIFFLGWRFWQYNFDDKFRADDYRILDQPVPDDLWFAPDGRLVSVRVNGFNVSVIWWDLQKGSRHRRWFDVRALSIRGPKVKYFLDKSGESYPDDILANSILFSISSEGDKVVWVEHSVLQFAAIGKGWIARPGVPLRLNGGLYPVHLSFTGHDVVTVLYNNGVLENIDIAQRRVGIAGTTLFGGWTLWSHGPVMAFSHFSSGDAALCQVANADKLDQFVHPKIVGGVSLAAWGNNRLAVGISNGSVAMLRRDSPTGPDSSVPIGPGKPVWAVAFYDPNRMFAGGDFNGLYYIEYKNNSFAPRLLLDAPSGVRKICAGTKYIAILSSSALAVASVGSHPALTDDGVFWMTLISLIVTIILGLIPLRDWSLKKKSQGAAKPIPAE